MKYVLVDRYDNIVTTKEFKGDVDVGEASTYFRKVKKVNTFYGHRRFFLVWEVWKTHQKNMLCT